MRPPATFTPPPSVLAIARQVRSGERSPVEVVQDALGAIGKADPEVGAFVSVDAEGALAQAEALAVRIAAARRSGDDPGPLAGVPLGVKDLEDAAGLRTTCGDPARAGVFPAGRDSVHVARLRAAGAIVLGKTATPQYGWKAETVSPLSGVTRNPRAPGRTPGGSSGGPAAALAAGMVALATGSDGGGSIRIPAACCGLPGFKPSTGVVPAGDDHAPAWGALSSRAPMTRSFAEVALALDVVSGPSDRDPASLPRLGSFADAAATASVEGLRVAWSPTLGYATPTRAVVQACEAAVARLERLGAVVEPVETVFTSDPLPAWLTLVAVGLRQEVLRHRPDPDCADLDEGLRAMVERGASVTAADHMVALDACQAVTLQLSAVWKRFDLLACPVTADLPPRFDRPSVLGANWVQHTYPFNLARCPAASVPAGVVEVPARFPAGEDERVPVGLQLVAPRLHDLRLMGAAAALEAMVS